jgi:2-amino-4-hydroxy-6-hydroxymethyldihydropteridine diphosphokinase
LGSNVGERDANIRRAITLIGERVGQVVRCSSLIETEPWGFESKNKFLNAVILCLTDLTPREVLLSTQKIERDMGRKNKPLATRHPSLASKRNGDSSSTLTRRLYADRPIDIDILLYDNLHIDEPDLKIPHPLMHQRDFVMLPLSEILDAP